MGERTEIAWCDHTFNAWIGCSKVSPGCTNCYAAVDTFARRSRARGLELWGPKGERHVTSADYWKQPERWNRAAREAGVRRRVFCASLSDVGEDRPDLVAPRERLVRLVERTPNLDYLFLTKRPHDIHRLMTDASFGLWFHRWPSNVWLGTTCEDQERADERIPHLLAVPARVRFVSYEPALGPVDFLRPVGRDRDGQPMPAIAGLDWIIVGGESGPRARPFDLAWARSTIRQCRIAGTWCFVKQLGSDPIDPSDPDLAALCAGVVPLGDRKGGDMSEWPEDLRVREFPEVRP